MGKSATNAEDGDDASSGALTDSSDENSKAGSKTKKKVGKLPSETTRRKSNESHASIGHIGPGLFQQGNNAPARRASGGNKHSEQQQSQAEGNVSGRASQSNTKNTTAETHATVDSGDTHQQQVQVSKRSSLHKVGNFLSAAKKIVEARVHMTASISSISI